MNARIWLRKDWQETKKRMSARLKFVRNFRYYRGRGYPFKASIFMSRNTL